MLFILKALIRDSALGNLGSSPREEAAPKSECVCEESEGAPISSLESPAAKGLQS